MGLMPIIFYTGSLVHTGYLESEVSSMHLLMFSKSWAYYYMFSLLTLRCLSQRLARLGCWREAKAPASPYPENGIKRSSRCEQRLSKCHPTVGWLLPISRPVKESHDRMRRNNEDVNYWVLTHRDGISPLFRVRHGCGLGQPFHRDCAIRTTVTRIASQRLLGSVQRYHNRGGPY